MLGSIVFTLRIIISHTEEKSEDYHGSDNQCDKYEK